MLVVGSLDGDPTSLAVGLKQQHGRADAKRRCADYSSPEIVAGSIGVPPAVGRPWFLPIGGMVLSVRRQSLPAA